MRRDLKVVILGATTVGKTSIIAQYIRNEFDLEERSTVGAGFCQKDVRVGEVQVALQIWDTAGQERFRSLTPIYYHDAKAALLVYDVTRADSFSELSSWADELVERLEDPPRIYVVGNKVDRDDIRVITIEEGQREAERLNGVYFETSAKTGANIEELFVHVAEESISTRSDPMTIQTEPSDTGNKHYTPSECC
jgi:small GTP-binding protein